ncbi:hypothetical protein Dimus_014943 [Dionaea muscipula]
MAKPGRPKRTQPLRSTPSRTTGDGENVKVAQEFEILSDLTFVDVSIQEKASELVQDGKSMEVADCSQRGEVKRTRDWGVQDDMQNQPYLHAAQRGEYANSKVRIPNPLSGNRDTRLPPTVASATAHGHHGAATEPPTHTTRNQTPTQPKSPKINKSKVEKSITRLTHAQIELKITGSRISSPIDDPLSSGLSLLPPLDAATAADHQPDTDPHLAGIARTRR